MQRLGDALGEIALDRKNIRDIAVVIVCPEMLVSVGVDQLHVDTHPVARATHTALENIGNTQRLANVTNVRRAATVLHHRGARNHLQVADLGQIRKHVVLNSVCEIRVGLIVTKIFKRQHGNRFVHFVGHCAWQKKQSCRYRNSCAAHTEKDYVAAPS